MDTLTEWTLANLAAHGAWILIFISYFGSLGIPFPITVVIVAAGALTRTGFLDWRMAMLACLAGAALADNSEYLLGHFALPLLKKRFGHKKVWQQAQSTINRHGGWTILLTRFWLTSSGSSCQCDRWQPLPLPKIFVIRPCRAVLMGAALRRVGLSLCCPVATGQSGDWRVQLAFSGDRCSKLWILFSGAASPDSKNKLTEALLCLK